MSLKNADRRLEQSGKERRKAAARKIDPDFRPETYFWPLDLRAHVMSHIKGVRRREILKSALAHNDIDTVVALSDHSKLVPDTVEAMGQIHPSFLGGEFLPDREEGEVEIARVNLDSTTADVTSVYVRLDDGVYHYRVVDEYEGETLTGPTTHTSDKPLTLGELIDFLESAWPIVQVLDTGFEGTVREKLDSFHPESAFYPQIDALYKRRVKEAYRSRRARAR